MNFEENLKKLKTFMKKENLDFFIVHSTDEFLSEYNELSKNSRYYISGFSGSTGDMLICDEKNYLFVDGRYHTQADNQVDKNIISVIKLGLKERQIIKIAEILKNYNKDKIKIGFVSSKMSLLLFRTLKQELNSFDFEFIEYEKDPILENIKTNSDYKIWDVPINITGKTVSAKLKELKKLINADYLIITKLDEIAYLSNLRSNQIPFSSSFKAKAIFNSKVLYIFTDISKISDEIKQSSKKIIFKPFEEFKNILNQAKDKKIAYVLSSLNVQTLRLLEKISKKHEKLLSSPIGEMKAVKTDKEILYMKKCFAKADKSIFKFQKWISKTVKPKKPISEIEACEKLKEFFTQEGAFELSFETILATNKNTALAHYHPTEGNMVEYGDLVLLDCGCYFAGGYATDSTRTFIAGNVEPNMKIKAVYTVVLKAFLNALNSKLSIKSSGFKIDKTARDIIDKLKPQGFEFIHSTGHGIGLNVHEFPPGIGSSVVCKENLKPNMCFTIEPGLYNENIGGVRLENSVFLDKNYEINSFSNLDFEDNLINFNLLTEKEKTWLEEYRKKTN